MLKGLLVILSILVNIVLIIYIVYFSHSCHLEAKDDLPNITYNWPFRADDINNLRSIIDNGSVVVVDKNNNVLLGYYNNYKFIPASIIKIATSASAFYYLKADYRFRTDISLDNNNNLYIRGLGDPLLTSYELRLMVKFLVDRGLTKVNSIYLDGSFFDDIRISGIEDTKNAYDAINTALAANYNTISYKLRRVNSKPIRVVRRIRGRKRIRYIRPITYKFVQGEKETPIFSFALGLLNSAKDDILGYKLLNKNKISIRDKSSSFLYFGYLFSYLLSEANVEVNGGVGIRRVPRGLDIYYRHYSSRSLTDIIKVLLKYSNNFIANQLTVVMGYKKFAYLPAGLGHGIRAVNDFLINEVGLGGIRMTEGSGVSYANRVSADDMVKLLGYMRQYKGLFSKYVDNVYAKTGGLKTVSSLAGYINSDRFGELRFVIILNQSTNGRNAVLKVILDALGIENSLG